MSDLHKTCRACNKELSLDNFYKHKHKKHGVADICKPCKKIQDKNYQIANKEKLAVKGKAYREKNRTRLLAEKKEYYQANKEKHREWNQARYKNNREEILKQTKAYKDEHKAERKVQSRNYYLKNKKKINEQNRIYRQTHKVEVANMLHEWYENNKDKFKVYSKSRKAKKKGNGVFKILNKYIRKLYTQLFCPYCNERLQNDRHIDHVTPLNKRGCHKEGNLIACCPTCNLKKHDKFLTEWKFDKATAA